MKNHILPVIIITGLTFVASAAEESEAKVSLDQMPAAAAKALKAQAGKDLITNVSKESENGKTVFEATFKRNGHLHDVTVDESGQLLSDEEELPASETPKKIREAIEREFPGAKIEKFERIREGGKTNYEVLLFGGKKREEIKFSDGGKVLEREDKTGKKDKD